MAAPQPRGAAGALGAPPAALVVCALSRHHDRPCRKVAFALCVIGAGAFVDLLGARPIHAAVGLAMLGTLPVVALVACLGAVRPPAPGDLRYLPARHGLFMSEPAHAVVRTEEP